MAYNDFSQQQIIDGINSSLAQGNGGSAILKQAYGLGIDPGQLISAVKTFNPSSYASMDDVTAQFNGAGDYSGAGFTNNTNLSDFVRNGYAGMGAPTADPMQGTGNLGMGGGAGAVGGAGGGGMSGGMGHGGPKLNAYSMNPYLQKMGEGLQTQFNNNLNMNTLPALRGGAVAVGGVGGSRQGIAEGLAASQSNVGADNAITNLYGQDYGQQMNRNLQQYQGDQQYNLGLGGLSNQKYGMDQQMYSRERGLDQSGAALGASLYGLGTQGPWNTLSNANGIYGNYTGFGNTATNQSAGGGAMGALGGALGAGQLAKNFGWFGGGSSDPNGLAITNGGGFSNTPNYLITG